MKTHRFAQAATLAGLLAYTFVAAPPLVASPRCKEPATITIPLQGFSRFHVYSMKEFRAIFDPSDTYTICTAELLIKDKHDVVLHATEAFDNGDGTKTIFREAYYKGNLAPNGRLELTWPEKWLEMNWATGNMEPAAYPNVVAQIEGETGYEIFGPAIEKNTVLFVGTFDGQKLFAGYQVFAFQKQPGAMGPPYDVVVDGPIFFSMWFDLQASP